MRDCILVLVDSVCNNVVMHTIQKKKKERKKKKKGWAHHASKGNRTKAAYNEQMARATQYGSAG